MIVDYCGHGDNRIFGGQRVVQRVLLGGGILLLQNSELCSVRPAARGVEEGREERPRFRFTRFSRYPRRDPQFAVRSPLFTIPDRRRLLVKAKRQTDFSLSDTLRYEIQQKQKQKQKQWQWQAGQKNANTQKNRGEEN